MPTAEGRRADEIEIGEGGEINPMVLPTGDLYEAATALKACSHWHLE